jgi:UDP-N-acetylmuramyl pentapeptide phosphotransferase/UDP-N-acetylglucosamine-1-phosphate transferase
MRPPRRLVGPATAAFVTVAIGRGLDQCGVSTRPAWTRPNYQRRPVSLAGGVAAAAGAVTGAVVAVPASATAILLAGVPAAAAGAYDDFRAHRVEQAGDKGWRGHVQAARSGRLSGGAVKVAVIGTGAWLAAGRGSRSMAHRAVTAGLVAGTANLVNLFDLRPGRAGKASLGVAAATLAGPMGGVAAAVSGAVLAELPADLDETRMLGDVGANTVGALLGLRLATGSRTLRAASLIAVVGLTAASERVSFSAVIARTPRLRRLDDWGRRPADPGQSPPEPAS